MTIKRLNDIKDERSRLVTRMKEFYQACETAGKGMTQEQLAEYRRMDAGVDDYDARISAFESDLQTRQALDTTHGGLIAPVITDDNAKAEQLQKRSIEA